MNGEIPSEIIMPRTDRVVHIIYAEVIGNRAKNVQSKLTRLTAGPFKTLRGPGHFGCNTRNRFKVVRRFRYEIETRRNDDDNGDVAVESNGFRRSVNKYGVVAVVRIKRAVTANLSNMAVEENTRGTIGISISGGGPCVDSKQFPTI